MDAQNGFPQNWRIANDYDPNQHLMNLKGREYLNVQNRLIWFIRDQRELIMRGLAQTTYVVQTDLVELDRQDGYAHFKTYVRDVLGNEATMYGSETSRDFPDYAEKASTKSLGRALALLGYGTQFAPEMDEGARVADSPIEAKQPTPARPQEVTAAPTPARATRPSTSPPMTNVGATDPQLRAIGNLCAELGKEPPLNPLTTQEAAKMISDLNAERERRKVAS